MNEMNLKISHLELKLKEKNKKLKIIKNKHSNEKIQKEELEGLSKMLDVMLSEKLEKIEKLENENKKLNDDKVAYMYINELLLNKNEKLEQELEKVKDKLRELLSKYKILKTKTDKPLPLSSLPSYNKVMKNKDLTKEKKIEPCEVVLKPKKKITPVDNNRLLSFEKQKEMQEKREKDVLLGKITHHLIERNESVPFGLPSASISALKRRLKKLTKEK